MVIAIIAILAALRRHAEFPHDAGDEYGVAPFTLCSCFTFSNRHCHSSLHRLPKSMPVNPFTTDQNPFLPTP